MILQSCNYFSIKGLGETRKTICSSEYIVIYWLKRSEQQLKINLHWWNLHKLVDFLGPEMFTFLIVAHTYDLQCLPWLHTDIFYTSPPPPTPHPSSEVRPDYSNAITGCLLRDRCNRFTIVLPCRSATFGFIRA